MPEKWQLSTGTVATLARNGWQLSSGMVAVLLRIMQMDEGTDVSTMIPYLSEYMGHGDFSTTMYYIHLIPENLTKNAGIDWERFVRIFPEIS